MKASVAAALAVAAVACTHGTTTSQAATPTKEAGQVRVEVTNHYSLSAEIYAAASGIQQRLGTVNPGTSRTFVMPPNMVGGGPVTIRAEITNESPVISDGLQLVAGDVVEFEIATHLMGSRARIRGQ